MWGLAFRFSRRSIRVTTQGRCTNDRTHQGQAGRRRPGNCFCAAGKKNALSNAMYRTATLALNDAQNNQAVRVVLFAAEGDAFTARK